MNNIVWAIDPFSVDSEKIQMRLQGLKNVLGEESIQSIYPVYVVNFRDLNWLGHVTQPDLNQFFEPALLKLESAFKGINFNKVKTPKVLMNHSNSRRKSSEILLNFAKDHQADFLYVHKKDKDAVDRLIMGSFTEELLFRTHLPTIVMNDRCDMSIERTAVFYPSDLEDNSGERLLHFMSKSFPKIQRVKLFHKISYPADMFLESLASMVGASGSWISVERDLSGNREAARKRAMYWVEQIQGKKGEIFIDESSKDMIDALIEGINLEEDVLVLSSDTSENESILLGSITREVLRLSSVPAILLPQHKEFE